MNAQAPTPDGLTVIALTNEPILRALENGPLAAPADVARATGLPAKNIGRQVELVQRDGLVTAERPLDLTDAGRRALQAIDLSRGVLVAGDAAPALPAEVGELLALRHDQMRPNPGQPRKHFDEEELEQLAATIHAADDVLQNLVVYPAGEDGVHDISAGERRWRAVGLLIERGSWPPERTILAKTKARAMGSTAFIALIENGQRARLTLMEEARAYAELMADKGWSAREAALQTGRDVRTVQEMAKVLREADADDIAKHEEDMARPEAEREGFTWEWLRNSVKAAKAEGEAEAEAIQADLEDVSTDNGRTATEAARFSREVVDAALTLVRDKPGFERSLAAKLSGTTTIEGEAWPAEATEEITTPWKGVPGVRIRLTMSSRGRWHVCLATQAGGPSHSYSGDAFGVWTNDPIFPSRDAALAHAGRRSVSQLGEWGAKRNLQTWLAALVSGNGTEAASQDPLVVNGVRYPNATRASEARRKLEGGGPRNSGGGTPKAEARAQAALDAAEPSFAERLALLELARKLEAGPGGDGNYMAVVTGTLWTQVEKYWLHSGFARLCTDLRLIAVTHTFPGGPHASFTEAGHAWLDAQDQGDEALEEANDTAGYDRDLVAEWRTPWLNVTRTAADPQEAPPPPDIEDDDVDGAGAAEALESLYLVSEAVNDSNDFFRPAVFGQVGVAFPLRAGVGAELGVIFDANGEALLTVDSDGHQHPDLVRARVLLIMTTLNAAVAEPAHATLIGDIKTAKEEEREPAVPIRRSITVDQIVCLEDGRPVLSLTQHLRTAYGIGPATYRHRWGLPRDYPMLAPSYAQARHMAAYPLAHHRPDADEDDA